jgi:L-2-hydroxyglutarate oxidase LhgO
MDSVHTVVIGAGVVGLAIARHLAMSGREVVILEQEAEFGTVTSARNSEVIHAGIYYEPGSVKARMCVEGKHRLYDFCSTHGVAHRRCGKLIVAADESQVAGLEKIEKRGRAAGVTDFRWLSAAQAVELEPALRCERALLSPSTGIVDSHGLMLALLGDAEDHGAMLARLSRFVRAQARDDGFRLEIDTGGETMQLACRELVNSAGLHAPATAAAIEGMPADQVPPAFLAKGNYFSLSGRCPFSRLIYPIPNQAGLGVHLTLDMAGQGRFGPDVEWVDQENYDVDPHRADSFYAEIRRYWPGLADGALAPAYAGIRPKIVGPDQPAADFVLAGASAHGLPGLVNLFGIESPGLTSCLPIAEAVARLLDADR